MKFHKLTISTDVAELIQDTHLDRNYTVKVVILCGSRQIQRAVHECVRIFMNSDSIKSTLGKIDYLVIMIIDWRLISLLVVDFCRQKKRNETGERKRWEKKTKRKKEIKELWRRKRIKSIVRSLSCRFISSSANIHLSDRKRTQVHNCRKTNLLKFMKEESTHFPQHVPSNAQIEFSIFANWIQPSAGQSSATIVTIIHRSMFVWLANWRSLANRMAKRAKWRWNWNNAQGASLTMDKISAISSSWTTRGTTNSTPSLFVNHFLQFFCYFIIHSIFQNWLSEHNSCGEGLALGTGAEIGLVRGLVGWLAY